MIMSSFPFNYTHLIFMELTAFLIRIAIFELRNTYMIAKIFEFQYGFTLTF